MTRARTGRSAPSIKQAAGWMHIAARNLLAEHEAGKTVDPTRLQAARDLLGLPAESHQSPARAFAGGSR